jgi:predicted HTH domain antitoxin
MDGQQDENDVIVSGRLNETESVSFSDAARFLGVDIFTFYSMVQREKIPAFLGAWGEFVVSQDDLDNLVVRKNALC